MSYIQLSCEIMDVPGCKSQAQVYKLYAVPVGGVFLCCLVQQCAGSRKFHSDV